MKYAKPFVCYRIKAREIQKTMEEISAISKKNDKSVYQYIRKTILPT